MGDWLDDLAEEIKGQKQRKEAERLDAQRRESRFRSEARAAFDEMDKTSETLSHTVNSRLYGGRKELDHGYIDYTITGDQFLLTFRNLRMEVRFDLKEYKVTYDTQSFHMPRGSSSGKYTPVNEASGELVFERDSDYGILRQGESVFSPQEAAQHLIGILIKAAEGVI